MQAFLRKYFRSDFLLQMVVMAAILMATAVVVGHVIGDILDGVHVLFAILLVAVTWCVGVNAGMNWSDYRMGSISRKSLILRVVFRAGSLLVLWMLLFGSSVVTAVVYIWCLLVGFGGGAGATHLKDPQPDG